MKKEIIVLAKSIKHWPNYCIAGIDVTTGEWIRPVSLDAKTEGAVPSSHITLATGEMIRVLDVVEIDFVKHLPTEEQIENYLYDETIPWKKVSQIEFDDLIRRYGLDCPEYIFGNTDKDVFDLDLNGRSLLLVKIENPYIVIKTFEKKKIQICFKYNGNHYNFIRVEDPNITEQFIDKDDGRYDLPDELYAVFSLTGRWNVTQKCYKVLATLF